MHPTQVYARESPTENASRNKTKSSDGNRWTPFPLDYSVTARPQTAPHAHPAFDPVKQRRLRIFAFISASFATAIVLGVAVANADADADSPPIDSPSTSASSSFLSSPISAVAWSQMRQVSKAREHLAVWVWGSATRQSQSSQQASAAEITPFTNLPLRHFAVANNAAAFAAIDIAGNLLLTIPDISPSIAFVTLANANLTHASFARNTLIAVSKSGVVFKLDLPKLNSELIKVNSSSYVAKPAGWLDYMSGTYTGPGILVDASSAISKIGFDKTVPSSENRIVSIATGDNHLLALSASGRVYSAALNNDADKFGQLGLGESSTITATLSHLLTPITTLKSIKIAQIAAGSAFSLARSVDGQNVYAWGDNRFGQLGTARKLKDIAYSSKPLKVSLISSSSEDWKCNWIAAGGSTAVMIVDSLNATEVFSVGMGQWGQLGIGNFIHVSNSPSKIAALSNKSEYSESTNTVVPIRIASVTLGATHAVAVMNSAAHAGGGSKEFGNDVFAWGANESGQLARVDRKKSNSAAPGWVQPVFQDNIDNNGVATDITAAPIDTTGNDTLHSPPKWDPKVIGRLQTAAPGKVLVNGVWGPRSLIVEQAFACAEGVTVLYSRIVG
ncbi:hypothetical protein HK100_008429 [Physocladia obscura]|uniref:Uncharacterized protein n=1 Tax=Physocladia obscura TaxID=109957 RepID=A0AAD5TBX9_9FUNG|nr:hypothetical protein HK100_008429 [Physocladia obscura]